MKNKFRIYFRQPSVKQSKPPPNLAEGIESAFLNIEFSGIVESEDQPEDSDSDRSDDDSDLDDVYVDISELFDNYGHVWKWPNIYMIARL